jgi:hypothetical protein
MRSAPSTTTAAGDLLRPAARPRAQHAQRQPGLGHPSGPPVPIS